MEAECTAFKEGFVGTAEEICGRTSGKPTQGRKKKEQWWWNQEVEQAIQEKKEALKCAEEVSDEEKTRLKQKYRCFSFDSNHHCCLLVHFLEHQQRYYSNISNEEKRWDISHWSKTSARCMGGVFQETPKP